MSCLIDITGKKFGRLTVLELDRTDKRTSFWKCKCDCGNVKIVVRNSLGRSTNSCGCLRRELTSQRGKSNKGKGLPFGVASKNKLFDKYKRQAEYRGLPFKLTMKHFETITKKNCFYCGVEPRQKAQEKKSNGYYVYNGIDRVDNSLGYVLDNCVPCCGTCNNAKHAMTKEEFLIWINRVYHHQTRLVIRGHYHEVEQQEIGDGTARWYRESFK